MTAADNGGAMAAGDTDRVTAAAEADDPHQWLEAVEDPQALDWVRQRNAQALEALGAVPAFAAIRDRLLTILDSTDRIPYVSQRGGWLYNFWRDATAVRGVWRRTTAEEYAKAEPRWDTLLDLDALAAEEGENWVWNGAIARQPHGDRCLLQFSRGGGDAVVIREFDVEARRFVADGFRVPEAKTDIVWADADRVYIATDVGPGSLTDSGYPRTVREWRRGTALADAPEVFAGEAADVAVGAMVVDSGGHHELIRRSMSFYSGEYWLRGVHGWTRLAVPDDASIDLWRGWLLVELRSDWAISDMRHPAGSLLAIVLADFLAGGRAFQPLYMPGPRRSLAGHAGLRSAILVNELDNVRNRLYRLTPVDGRWTRTAIDVPGQGTLSVAAVDDEAEIADGGDDYWLTVTDFLTPTTLYRARLGGDRPPQLLKALPAYFDAAGLAITQHEVVSKDGTRVPYFQVARQDLQLDGQNPTLLYGYGGFEVSMLPSYSAGVGAAWLEKGGIYVLANIRGGGEFGPVWHQAALKDQRQRAYDDFIAVAEDLIDRRVTAPPHLGIQGGSNGGLLMGVMLTQRPELFGAVVCQVPLLDMRRYHRLLAGASWVGEYGNPDLPEEWAWIARYSPYQRLRADATYPPVLFTTSTRDDRVHPGHARKMAAKMQAQGHDLLYYENLEGGHGGAANNAQSALMGALAYAFLWRKLAR